MPKQPETPKLQLGVPGVASLELPLTSGWLYRLRSRLFSRWPERIHAAGAQIMFHVMERDHGSMDIYVTLANFGRRPVWVEAAHLSWIAVGNGGIDELAAVLPSRTQLAGRSLSRVLIRLTFGAATVRRLCSAIGRPHGGLSSPLASTTVRGRFELSRGQERVTTEFVVESITPQLLFGPTVCAEDQP